MTERKGEWRNPNNSAETNAEIDAWIEEMDTPAYKHGYDVGESMGEYKVSSEAIRAYEAGDIDLWIEYMRPKSQEDWDAFHETHGDRETLKKRWSKPLDNDDKDN